MALPPGSWIFLGTMIKVLIQLIQEDPLHVQRDDPNELTKATKKAISKRGYSETNPRFQTQR